MKVYILWITKLDKGNHEDSYWDEERQVEVYDYLAGVFSDEDLAETHWLSVDDGEVYLKYWIVEVTMNVPIH